MNRNYTFYFVFSVLLFLAGASFFPILEYFEINIDQVLLLVQAFVGVSTMLIALVALDSWRHEKRHDFLSEISLIMFDIREIVISVRPFADKVHEAFKFERTSGDVDESFYREFRAIKRTFFNELQKYKKNWIKLNFDVGNDLDKYSPVSIETQFYAYLECLGKPLNGGLKAELCFKFSADEKQENTSKAEELVRYLDEGLDFLQSRLNKY